MTFPFDHQPHTAPTGAAFEQGRSFQTWQHSLL